MAKTSSTKKTDESAKEGVAQSSTSYQMQQWLSESDKDAPWTPLSLTTTSTQQADVDPTIKENIIDTSSNCAAQGSTPDNASIPEKSV
ncbi:hypothetical protein ACHAQJ_007550 [Trichoderma viride]